MKYTVLKKSAALLLLLCLSTCLSTCLAVCLILPAAAEDGRVYDPAKLLTESEASSLAARMDALSEQYGVEFYFATYVAENRYDDFIGDEYCRDVRNLRGKDAVLLIVTYESRNRMYYYDMYTYGDANYDINQKEVNYILDDSDVYYNLKGGEIHNGATAFFELSAKAFDGRLGAPIALIIVISAGIAIVIGLAVCAGVVASYKKKRASVDYPLEHFARLELTREKDSFVREYTTRTYVPRSSGGGGGSRHGGGGGHRGGR